MYCPRCGLDNEEELTVCKRCGEKLKDEMTLKRKYGQPYNESNNLNNNQNTQQNNVGYAPQNNFQDNLNNNHNANYNDFGYDNSNSRGYKIPESNQNQQSYYNNANSNYNNNNFPSNNYQNANNFNSPYNATNDYPNYFEYSGFWKRLIASIIDGVIVGIGSLILTIVTIGIGSIALPFAGWLYFALFESSKYQATPGKMALGMIVTDLDGNKISFGRASGRYWAKFISNFTLYIGYIMAGFTEKKQALHDIIASCLVVNK